MKQHILLGMICALSVFSGAVLAAPGDLDLTFNGTGYSVINTPAPSPPPPPSPQDYGHALTIDGSGNILVAGNTGDFNGADFMLARFTSAGVPDATFGGGDGYIIDDFSGVGDIAYGVAVDGSGNIALTGRVGTLMAGDWAIALYDSTGNLNTGFNGTGRVTLDSSTANDEGVDITFDASGRIVAAGEYNDIITVVRYTLDGNPDLTFSTNGRAEGQTGDAEGLVIDSTGRIIVAGRDGNNSILISRFNTDGTLDGTFGAGGNVSTNLGGTAARADAVTVDSSNRIIVAGRANNQFFAARFTTAGILDTTFNGTGYHIVDIGPAFDMAYGVALTSTGEIVIAGNAGSNNGIASFNDDGTLNTDFGTGGIANVDVTGSGQQDWANDMVLDSQDRIVTAGQLFITGLRFGLTAARFDHLPEEFEVTAAVALGNGTITPPTQNVVFDGTASFTVTPDLGWSLTSVDGDTCTPVLDAGDQWIAANITEPCAVTASFAQQTFEVTASVALGNGTITPATQNVVSDGTASFTVTPDLGWSLTSVDGDTCTPVLDAGDQWIAANITEPCAVTASFSQDAIAPAVPLPTLGKPAMLLLMLMLALLAWRQRQMVRAENTHR